MPNSQVEEDIVLRTHAHALANRRHFGGDVFAVDQRGAGRGREESSQDGPAAARDGLNYTGWMTITLMITVPIKMVITITVTMWEIMIMILITVISITITITTTAIRFL